MAGIGEAMGRKESWNKVSGAAKYMADAPDCFALHAALKLSPHAHARIARIDTCCAMGMPGVRAVVLGRDVPVLCGEEIRDRPILAIDVARYAGEPVAMVVADTEAQAIAAAGAVAVEYVPLPAILSADAAAAPGAPLLHPGLMQYVPVSEEILPEPGTNIAHRVRIRKGDIASAFVRCAAVAAMRLTLPMADHVAMETRAAQAEIFPDGRVVIDSCTQAPHGVKALVSDYFSIPSGLVTVRVPLVGGAFGGKAAIQLELLAYAASRAARGRAVRIQNTREQDFACSPGKEGLVADIRLGAAADGRILAMDATYYVDSGAYANSIPRVARAIAQDCAGPYNIPNVRVDALSVYTNHPYATSYRGFGHTGACFVLERAMDRLAQLLNIDALQLRSMNAIAPGHTTATQSKMTLANAGNFAACLDKLAALIDWPGRGDPPSDGRHIRAIGIGCFFKAPSSKPDATSGAILTFNADGSLNLHMAVVEIGPGMRTVLAQIVADAMGMDAGRVFVSPGFDTHTMPEHWKTVASMSTFLAGNAALRAVEDVKRQLRAIACTALHALPEELEIAGERAFLRENPARYACFADLIHGCKLPTGETFGAQLIGRGGYTIQRVTPLDPATGAGEPSPVWTPGAQAVEIELDARDLGYRLLNAWTVIDAGRVLNPPLARGVMMGGMAMGLSLGSREAFDFDAQGRLLSGNLRSYKPLHIGGEPRYHVAFVETPHPGAPYGARPIAEHSILGMPAALANALSRALGAQLSTLPLTPEALWRARGGHA